MKLHYTVALLIAFCGAILGQQPWAANLIDLMTYDRDAARGFSGGCRQPPHFDEAQALIQSLSAQDLETEVDGIEQRSYPGPNANWIWNAYARAKGPGAGKRLREVEQSSKFSSDQQFGDDSIRRELDKAIALSLDLTSYVSSSPGDHLAEHVRYICAPLEGHRDVFDDFIRAFERGDEVGFNQTLGPEAHKALDSLLKDTTWSQLRAAMLRGKRSGDLAVGYRLDAEFGVRFTSSSGAECGRYQLKFMPATPGFHTGMFYLVSNSDLGELMRIIASCAVTDSPR